MFRVGLTRDFLNQDGTPAFGDIGLDLLDAASGVEWEYLAENTRELRADQIRDYDALAVLAPRVTAATLEGAERLALIARYGVGYDSVDVEACTRHGVLLTITPDGVRRPMATVVLTYLLALSHRLLEQDRLTRAGGWTRKLEVMGTGLTGKTLGLIGLGNIGREVVKLAAPLELRFVAHDPYVDPAQAAAHGVDLVDLETLLRNADFVVTLCALTPATRHLLNAERLALMKPTAYLISVARGPIVDQAALTAALQERRIAGAGMDVFEQEPVDPNDPILSLGNVIVSPHALCWTDEWAYLSGQSACRAILEVAAGRVPNHVVNREAIETLSFQEKLARYRA
jgi:D-3-phosphoglycerate dehydrogenase